MTDLLQNIVKYIELLQESKTSQVAHWTIEYIQQCADWCILIETEFSLLDFEDRRQCLNDFNNLTKSKDQVPTATELLGAQHHFFFILLQNKYMSNQVYNYILNHYQFLTIPDKDLLYKDLSLLSNKSAAENILQDMFNILKNQSYIT